MIVKKLSDVSGGNFPGVAYNENKVASGIALLMSMQNVSEELRHKVEILHEAGLDCSGEIEKYLKEQSKTFGNTRTTRFQFHVSASVKGKLMSAEELTDFAKELMQQAGYGCQPYFVYFHNDTDNNHIHIVSTRIKPNGFPISDHQDYRRLNTCANRILSHDIKKDIEGILDYDYETEGQFANIIRSYGYKFEKTDKDYRLFKAGGDAGEINIDDYLNHLHTNKDDIKRKERATQLRAIIRKYQAEIAEGKYGNEDSNTKADGKNRKKRPVKPKSNPDIKKILDDNGNTLSQEQQKQIERILSILKSKFGIDVYFQKDRNGQVRGYGIVDHSKKMAFDGSKVMKLSDLIDFTQKAQKKPAQTNIYKELFTPEIISTPRGWFVRIKTNDGSYLEKEISGKQFVWYDKSKPEDKEEIAYRIAATMFSKEILSEYLKLHPVSDWNKRLEAVNAVKNREGGFSIRIVMKDGYTLPLIRMKDDECRLYRSMSKEEVPAFIRHLALNYLNEEDAMLIIKRLKEEINTKTGTLQLPLRERDYSPEIVTIFSNGLSTVLSSLNVSTASSGYNREWEVGNRKKYDTTDDQNSGKEYKY